MRVSLTVLWSVVVLTMGCAPGADDPQEFESDDDEEEAGDVVLGSVEQAVDVAGRDFGVGPGNTYLESTYCYETFYCSATWTKDATHVLESSCKLQTYRNGAWRDATGWVTWVGSGVPYKGGQRLVSSGRIGIGEVTNLRVRVLAAGRIKFAGGWSPVEYSSPGGSVLRTCRYGAGS